MRRILSILFAACLTAGAWALDAPLPTLHVEGKWLVDTYGNHVVLHGVMDTPSMWFNDNRWTGGYNATGAKNCIAYFHKLFDGMKQANCDVFRLHLDPAWTNDNSVKYVDLSTQPEHKGGDLPTGEANIEHFNATRLKTFLKSLYIPLMMDALEHGLYVVVRPPGVCPNPIYVDGYYQKYMLEVWDIVSSDETIRNYAGQISLELANEPVSVKNASGQSDAKALRDFFQPVVDKIRANGFTGVIWIPGSGWQSSYADYKTYPIKGDNIGYAVHDYDGWYGCADKNLSASDVKAATQRKITQFHNQVPVVDTNPIIITEIDWSPTKPGTGHYNEHGNWVESNYGTWATGRTSVWGTITKGVHDHYGNISMTLSGSACLFDIDKLLKTGVAEPAFGGLEEACGKACFDWYAEYAKVNNPKPDYVNEAPVSDLGNGKFMNPVVRADFPDPDVIRVGDTYYMVSTTMCLFPGATILKSKDMVNWEYCCQPLTQLATTDNYNLKNGQSAYAGGMWACSMKYNEADGKFYLLINGNDAGGFILSTTNPEGTWQKKKLPRIYYDPGMLFDNGKVYIACGNGNISVCELDMNFNLKQEKTVIQKPGSGLEGCHFYKKGDYYYIYATYGGWPSGQAAFRSKNPMGPYDEEKMLVEKNINGQVNTIHQGSLIEDVNGSWWTIMQEDLGALGRFPNLQPVKWVDGWPIVGKNGVPYKTFVDQIDKPATAEAYPQTKRLPTTDNFRSYPLGMQWEWNHNPDNDNWSLFEHQGWLRLKTATVVSKLHQARNMLTQRIFIDNSKTTKGTVRVDVSRLQEGDRAGICIFQDPYAAIAVEMKDGKRQIVWWKEGVKSPGDNFTPQETYKEVELTDNIVYLRGAIKYGENKAMFYYSTDGKTWKKLGGDTSQSFNLSVFVGSRFGLFCYSTKTAGGSADFDWFSTEDEYDEEGMYGELKTTLDENMFTVTKIVPAKKTLDALVGGYCSPGITATYKDKHTEVVTAQTVFTPEDGSVVEFRNGQMAGLSQGKTRVTATFTDLFGNQVDTAFTARSGYFPLDAQYIKTDLAGTGTYKFTSTTSAEYGLFKFTTKDSQMGWVYDAKHDFSGFHYLVINQRYKPTGSNSINFYITKSVKGARCEVPITADAVRTETGFQTVVCLDTLKYTMGNNKGKPLNLKSINMVTFTTTAANKSLYITDMLLTTEDPTTGIVDVAWQREAQQRQTVNVYTLSGRMVRRAVSRKDALQGLPAGLYLMEGRKVLVK